MINIIIEMGNFNVTSSAVKICSDWRKISTSNTFYHCRKVMWYSYKFYCSKGIYNFAGNSKEQTYSLLLQKYLCCDVDVALNLIRSHPPILELSPRIVRRNSGILQNCFNLSEIIANPRVICSFQIYRLENSVHVLKELGFQSVGISTALSLKELLQKTVNELMKSGLIPANVDSVENLLSSLDCNSDGLLLLREKFEGTSKEKYISKRAYDLRIDIIKYFLCWKFSCTSNDVEKLINKHKEICYKSLSHLSTVTTFILTEVQMPIEKVLSNGWLLTINPCRLHDIVNQISELGGKEIREVILKCPKILYAEPEDLKEIQQYLCHLGITNEQIQKCPWIFCLKPLTVQQRLEKMLKIEEFRARLSFPRFLQLVLSEETANQRLKYFRRKKDATLSLDLLTKPLNEVGKLNLFSHDDKTKGKESVEFLSKELEKSVKEVRVRLKQHPNYKSTSLVVTKKILEILRENGVTKEQLWCGLPIVLYGVDDVKRLLTKLPKYKELQPIDEWKQNPYFVQLLIYLLEREKRLAGEGIFQKA